MRERIWTHVQLALALWLIPVTPPAVMAGVAYALDWPAWGIPLLVLTATWPVAWYIWLMGDDNAIRR